MKIRCAVIITAAIVSASGQVRPPSAVYPVGYEANGNLAIWYPSSGEPAPYPYSDQLAGSVVLNGPPREGEKFPLVVFSHGFRGCKTQSVYLTEELARHGYVVAAPDHADASCGGDGGEEAPGFRDPESWTDQTHIGRRDDIRALIDKLLADPVFGPLIDASKIAGAGHSLGGYTMFALAGGWENWYDSRLTAVLLLSPYVDPFRVQNRLPAVTVPKMFQGGTLDLGITPSIARQGGVYDQSLPEKFFLELRRAGHFEWTNSVCAGSATVAQCVGQPGNADLIVSFAIAFLDRQLKSQTSRALLTGNPRLADYRRQLVF